MIVSDPANESPKYLQISIKSQPKPNQYAQYLASSMMEAAAALAASGEEEPSCLAKTTEETPAAEEEKAAVTKKKTKKVMKRVSEEKVEKVLAAKPTPRTRPSPASRPTHVNEERDRCSAWVDEVVRANNELIRSLQEDFRRQLHTKGYVEVEAEVTDDEASSDGSSYS
ncbi:hypothetical protein ACP70R_021843 [Stipagrostis hirtigluma subsp. patula]